MAAALKYDLTDKHLISVGVIAQMAAIWHLLCIWGGVNWFVFARAPQQIITSAAQGTLLAPIATLVVAGLMLACSIFAFSAAGVIRRVPLMKSALVSLSILCILRGASALITLIYTLQWDVWQMVASSVWLYVGICFAAGSVKQYRRIRI